jgi:retron-type reverse transcriptase
MAIWNLQNNSVMELNGDQVATNIGVPQGSVLSPQLHNIYINQTLEKMKQYGKVLAFADDIVFLVKGEWNLMNLQRELTLAFDRIDMRINKEKSNIMQIIKAGNQKQLKVKAIRGIPLAKTIKYLGCTLDQ